MVLSRRRSRACARAVPARPTPSLRPCRRPQLDRTLGCSSRSRRESVDFHAAVLWARRAAEAGAPDAQAMLAYILSHGPEELRDPDAAFGWYRKSAEQDCPQGRLGYAIALMRTRRYRGESACRARPASPRGGSWIADCALSARPECRARGRHGAGRCQGAASTTRSRQRPDSVARRRGSACCCSKAAGDRPTSLNGESWLRRAALGGDAEAAALLGDIYARGGALPPNYAEAARWFRTAAERGQKAAARALGMLYLTGAGVARDPDEAATWFKRAAEAGDRRCPG